MKYRCLRNCYVNDRFWSEGETYELPDDMVKSAKHFQPVGESVPETQTVEPTAPKAKPEVIPEGMFWCGKHQTLHKLTSSVGKKCLKRIEKEEAEEKAKRGTGQE